MLHSLKLKPGNDRVAPGVKVVRQSMPKPDPMRIAVLLLLCHSPPIPVTGEMLLLKKAVPWVWGHLTPPLEVDVAWRE